MGTGVWCDDLRSTTTYILIMIIITEDEAQGKAGPGQRGKGRPTTHACTHVVEDEGAQAPPRRVAEVHQAPRGPVEHPALVGRRDDENAHVEPVRCREGLGVAPHPGVGVVRGGGGGVGPAVCLIFKCDVIWFDFSFMGLME